MKLIELYKKHYSYAVKAYSNLSDDPASSKCGVCSGWIAAVGVYILMYMSVGSWWFLLTAPLLTVLLFIMFAHAAQWLLNRPGINASIQKTPWRGALIITVATMLFYGLLLYFTGVMTSMDTQLQWMQIQQGKFDDWHPVAHTFSIYLFARIWENDVFVAGCFAFIFSMLCGWFYYTLRQYGLRCRSAAILVLLVAFSPLNIYALRVLWKDTAFLIALFGVGIAMIHLYCSGGKWLEKWYNQVFLCIFLLYAAFVRHNGIFFTGVFILFLPFLADKWHLRWKLIAFSGVVLLLCGGYVYCRKEMIKRDIITQHGKDQSFHEAVGIPMAMMTQAFVSSPEKLPPEVIEFMTAVMPWEKWKEYHKGDFNSVKFNAPGNLMGDVTPAEFFKLFVATFKAAPGECMEGFLFVSALGWEPWWHGSGKLRFTPLGILLSPGFYVMLLLILTLWLLPSDGIKVFFMSLPFASYSYGTALLLMGFDHRFFWGGMVGSVPVLVALFIQLRRGKSSQNVSEVTAAAE